MGLVRLYKIVCGGWKGHVEGIRGKVLSVWRSHRKLLWRMRLLIQRPTRHVTQTSLCVVLEGILVLIQAQVLSRVLQVCSDRRAKALIIAVTSRSILLQRVHWVAIECLCSDWKSR